MIRLIRALLVGLSIGLGATQAAGAQGTCTAAVGTKCSTAITLATPNASSVTNPRVVTMTASPAAGSWSVRSNELDAGTSGAVPVTVTVSSNRSWAVALSGPSAWSVSGGATAGKPVGDVRWSIAATGAGTPLSASAATVAAGTAGGSQVRVLYFRTLLGWTTDAPGTYVMPLSFTVTSP